VSKQIVACWREKESRFLRKTVRPLPNVWHHNPEEST